MASTSLDPLPFDLIVSGIFPKLPLTSIVRCKTVCKTWLKLLNDPFFLHNYYQTKKQGKDDTTLLVSWFVSHPPKLEYFLYLIEIDSKNRFNLTRIDSQFPNAYVPLLHISCNGFILCHKPNLGWGMANFGVSICNPMTGETIQLPKKSELFQSLPEFRTTSYIFGYVSTIKKFKVLRVAQGLYLEERVVGEILTVGVDVGGWRNLSCPLNDFLNHGDGLTFDGVYHWTTLTSKNTSTFWIYTFDLHEENVGPRMSPPRGLNHKGGLLLRVLNNHLCIFNKSDPSEIVIWTMKEYGVAESWTKDVIRASWCPYGVLGQVLSPIARLGSGEILFLSRDRTDLKFIYFNTGEKKCEQVNVEKGDEAVARLSYAIHYNPCLSAIKDVVRGV